MAEFPAPLPTIGSFLLASTDPVRLRGWYERAFGVTADTDGFLTTTLPGPWGQRSAHCRRAESVISFIAPAGSLNTPPGFIRYPLGVYMRACHVVGQVGLAAGS